MSSIRAPVGERRFDESTASNTSTPSRGWAWPRWPGDASRQGATYGLKAGQHDPALRRTVRRAAQIVLKRAEQSVEFFRRAVSQLAAGDDLRHRYLLFVARPRRSGPFLRSGESSSSGKGLSDGGLSGSNQEKEGEASPARCCGHRQDGEKGWTGRVGAIGFRCGRKEDRSPMGLRGGGRHRWGHRNLRA